MNIQDSDNNLINTTSFFSLLYSNLSNNENQNVILSNNKTDTINICVNNDVCNAVDNNDNLETKTSESKASDDASNNPDDSDNYCLISYEPLENKHIKLLCGHKFNYKHIYSEVCNQKLYYKQYEVCRLMKNQIKCPYCRNVQNYLLPQKDGFKNIKRVNSPLSQCMLLNECKYIFKSGKRKNDVCGKRCFDIYCKTHERVVEKQKVKEEEKKKLHKTNNDKGKDNDKDKDKDKCIIKNNQIEKCKAILKSGKRKGELCGCKVFSSESNHCKRHINTILQL